MLSLALCVQRSHWMIIFFAEQSFALDARLHGNLHLRRVVTRESLPSTLGGMGTFAIDVWRLEELLPSHVAAWGT